MTVAGDESRGLDSYSDRRNGLYDMLNTYLSGSERLIRIALAGVIILFSAQEETSLVQAMAGYVVGTVLIVTALTNAVLWTPGRRIVA
ncbi:MAG: hypothetical protein AB7V39_15270 [Nitrospiraceae bacterium]